MRADFKDIRETTLALARNRGTPKGDGHIGVSDILTVEGHASCLQNAHKPKCLAMQPWLLHLGFVSYDVERSR